jgi:hypothetical protein
MSITTPELDEHVLAEAVAPVEQPLDTQSSELAANAPPSRVSLVWPQSWPMRAWYGLEWLFGLASLLGCLAVMAAIPIANFVSLGYLLEASGRVARTGKIRDGFIDIGKFARIGSVVAGTWLCLLVPRLVSSLARDAALIDPGSLATSGWRIGLIVCTVLVIGHILLAWYSGGRLRHFFWPLLAPFQLAGWFLFGGVIGPILRPTMHRLWPAFADDFFRQQPLADWFPPAILVAGIRRGQLYAEARDAVWDFTVGLNLPHYFWLGLRGFVGGLVWLIVPSLMLMAGTSGRGDGTIFVGYLGALLLAVVLFHLPFLQTNFALQNRLAALFDWREVRRQFKRAPIAYWLALASTLLFALPLYLLKIEPPPRELWWTLTIFFIVFIYPARLLAGWAVGRALARQQPRLFAFRWLSRLAALPIVLFYILVLFFTQYTSFLGPASLLEQHAFLVPVPFLSL